MESKKVLKSNNLTRYLTIGGIGAAILGISYYLVKRSKKKELNDKETNQTASIDKVIPKEIVLKLLRELRKAYYPILMDIYAECEEVAAKWDGKIPNDTIQSIHESKYPEIDAVRHKIAAKYGFNQSDMDRISFILYKNDPDVRQLDKVISRDFVQIFKGDKCFEGTTIPEFLTPQRVLKIMTKHNQRALLRVSELLQEAGKNYEELKADAALYRRKNQIQRETRTELLIEEGLDDFEDHPDKIFDWARIKYLEIDDFRIKHNNLVDQAKALLPRLHIRNEDLTKAIEEVGKDILENDDHIEIKTIISNEADKI